MRHVTCSEPGRAPMIAFAAVILLCVVLPFALSFVADTIVLVVRRSAAGVPALVVVVGVSVAIAGAGLLLAYLSLEIGTAPAELERAVSLGRGLLLVCLPLAVTAMLVRLWIATLPRRRRDPEG